MKSCSSKEEKTNKTEIKGILATQETFFNQKLKIIIN